MSNKYSYLQDDPGFVDLLDPTGQVFAAVDDKDTAIAITSELNRLTAKVETLTRERDEARRYGALKDDTALSWVKNPCNIHNQYWTTSSGSCMACRACEAEYALATARSELERVAGIASQPPAGGQGNG